MSEDELNSYSQRQLLMMYLTKHISRHPDFEKECPEMRDPDVKRWAEEGRKRFSTATNENTIYKNLRIARGSKPRDWSSLRCSLRFRLKVWEDETD
jgi:hypothetical protein